MHIRLLLSPADDRLTYYISCPLLWSLAQDSISAPLPDTPLTRTGVTDASFSSLPRFYCCRLPSIPQHPHLHH